MSDQTASKPRRRLLVTSALPYANGDIHIGHMVEHIQTDIWCRFQRMRGHECIAVCADDTHGTPVMVRARALGITPESMVEQSKINHERDFIDFEVSYDHYSSTHTEENRLLAEEFYHAMKKQNHIDVRPVQQLYCDVDKMFLPDRFVKGQCPNCSSLDQYGDSCDTCGATYSPMELVSPRCAICSTKPVQRSSDHVFFKLNDFREFLREWMPSHTQPEVAQKLLEWFSGDLRDWDISRDAPYFGFQIPGFEDKYFYVWVDAPMGYVSSTWQWCKLNHRSLDEFWKSDSCEIHHFIGKDITYFHLLFWPALLKTSTYNLPTAVHVHGHLTVNGEKMSKSKGTSIKARSYLQHLDPMYLRYYYASKLNGGVGDIDLSVTDFVNRVNSDLVGKITNLGSRGAQMLSRRIDGRLGKLSVEARALVKSEQDRTESLAKLYENRDYARLISEIREMADRANRYFDEKAPWNLIKTDVEATREALTVTINLFRLLTIYLTPILPSYSRKVAHLLRENESTGYHWAHAQTILEDCTIADYEHLATRIEEATFNKIIQESIVPDEKPNESVAAHAPQGANAAQAASAQSPSSSTTPLEPEIDFDQFAKVDLRVAKIIHAEEIKEADKLLRLKVDLGELGERQIIAGIKAAYRAEDLVGRLTVIVANLKPRKMKFGMSEGMVLAAGPGGSELSILSPDSRAKPGQKIK